MMEKTDKKETSSKKYRTQVLIKQIHLLRDDMMILDPLGSYDKRGRFFLSEKEQCECCKSIRNPSIRFPYEQFAHGVTEEHIRHLANEKPEYFNSVCKEVIDYFVDFVLMDEIMAQLKIEHKLLKIDDKLVNKLLFEKISRLPYDKQQFILSTQPMVRNIFRIQKIKSIL